MSLPIQSFIQEVANVIKITAKKIIVSARNMGWYVVLFVNVRVVKMERLF